MRALSLWILLIFILSACRVYYQAPSPTIPRPFRQDTPTSEEASLVYSYVNLARSKGGVCGNTYYAPALSLYYDAFLERIALKHSQDMQAGQQMSHITPAGAIHYSAGSRLRDRFNHDGYNWQVIGENVAWNYPSARAVVEAWLASPEHCANILSPEFTHIGVARAGDYWTQNFALPKE